MTPQQIEELIQLTRRLVRTPSVNPMGEPADPAICFEGRVTDLLADLFTRRGLATFRDTAIPSQGAAPARDNILAYLPGRPGSPTVMLEAHQDTVPVIGMTIDPFAAELREGRIWGRGACDVKGGMAAMLMAFFAIAEHATSDRPHVVMACAVNEEHGFSGSKRLKELWEQAECPFMTGPPQKIVVAEPTELNVVVAHKGVVRWRCRTRGRATHSSSPAEGINAIYGMGHVVSALEIYARDIVHRQSHHPLLGPPTLSVGTIRGGVSVNTVPDQCEIHVDRRILPGETHAAARQHVIDYVTQAIGGDFEVEHEPPDICSPYFDTPAEGSLAQSLLATIRRQGHHPQATGVQFGTDASILGGTGIPTVIFGPGSIAQAHTADEWLDVGQLVAATQILIDFLTSMCLEAPAV